MITNDFIVSNSGINVSGRLQLGMLAADAQFSYYNHVRLTLNPPVTKIMTYMFCVAVYLKRQRIIMNYFAKKTSRKSVIKQHSIVSYSSSLKQSQFYAAGK